MRLHQLRSFLYAPSVSHRAFSTVNNGAISSPGGALIAGSTQASSGANTASNVWLPRAWETKYVMDRRIYNREVLLVCVCILLRLVVSCILITLSFFSYLTLFVI